MTIQRDNIVTKLSPRLGLLGESRKSLADLNPITSMLNCKDFTIKVNELLTSYDGRVGVFMLKFNRFQLINEVNGHAVGERLLEEVAERLLIITSVECVWANYWGDKFFLAVPSIIDEARLSILAQDILYACRQPWAVDRKNFFLSAAIGIAVSPTHGLRAEQLMKNADLALAQTQELGYNTYQFYHIAFAAKLTENLKIEEALRCVLDQDGEELFLTYQPRINLRSGEINSFEALIRWTSKKLGQIGPAQFIPVAEASGLISKIDQWVISNVCQQIKEWRDRGQNVCISVNLSASELYDEQLLPFIVSTLREFQVNPWQLEIEITETMVMQNMDEAISILQELKQIGVRIALDDFGTGYSSLTNLKRLPIDTLKIDQSFIQDVEHSTESKSIVQVIITLGHILNLKVTAEGVETYSQFVIVESHACDEVQGFHFSRPLLPDAAYWMLVNGNVETEKLKKRLIMDSSCL
jgi:diguanylate cyclase (GGDEF)-like protein